METFDVEGARRAAAEGWLGEWLVASLRRDPGANRNLAAILKGQEPLLEAPMRMPLAELPQMAGPGPDFKWAKDPAEWEAGIAALLPLEPESLPPLILRETAGGRHLSDGNHRLDAWQRRGETHGWVVVWRDRHPWCEGWWGPFPPERTAKIEIVSSSEGFLPPVETEGTILAARVGERIVGALRLVPEFGGLTLRTVRVDPGWRGHRLGARLMHHARPLMEGQTVHCLAFPWLARFYGEFGFAPVDPSDLPYGLRARYEGYQDEKRCVALRRAA